MTHSSAEREPRRWSNASVAESEFAGFAAVLIEDGGLGVLKDGIAGGVSGFEFLLDFGGELVGGILGLPPAAGEAELVADGAIGDDALAAGEGGEFGHQGPTTPFGGFIEQGLKRSLETQFVSYGLAFEMLEILEVRFDERVVGGELKHCESAWYQAARGWRSARARPGRKSKIHNGFQMRDEGVPPHQTSACRRQSRYRPRRYPGDRPQHARGSGAAALLHPAAGHLPRLPPYERHGAAERKSTRLNSSHLGISYA